MKNIFFSLLGVIALSVALSQFVWSQSADKTNDSEVKRYEVGGHISGLFLSKIDAGDEVFRRFGFPEAALNNRFLDIGFGGRFTYNINRNLAVEGEVNYFPGRATINERGFAGQSLNVAFSGGKKTQFLAGVKYGIRRSKYGVFGKVRPGAIRFTAYPKVIGRAFSSIGDDILIASTEAPAKFFNMDVGGVFEYYPTRKVIFRVDVGDIIIRYNAQKPKDINPNFIRHNLQTSIGFGFRF